MVDTCPEVVVERPSRRKSKSGAAPTERRYAKGRCLGKGGFAMVHALTGACGARKTAGQDDLWRCRGCCGVLAAPACAQLALVNPWLEC